MSRYDIDFFHSNKIFYKIIHLYLKLDSSKEYNREITDFNILFVLEVYSFESLISIYVVANIIIDNLHHNKQM
jgi:hypothetical protein